MTDIIGAIDASINLAGRTYKLFQALKNAKADIEELEEEIEAALFTLREIKGFYEETGPNGFDHPSTYKKQVERLQSQLGKFQATCNALHTDYTKLSSAPRRAMKVKQIRPDKDKLTWHLETLELLLLVGNLRQTQRVIRDLKDLEEIILTGNTKADFKGLVDSLCDGGNPQRSKAPDDLGRSSFQPPKWIFDDPAFRQWFASTESAWLCCLGRQGAGKSSLASYLVKKLQMTSPGVYLPPRCGRISPEGLADAGLAIFYFNYKAKAEQSTITVLKSLCGQLLEQLWRADPYLAYTRSFDMIAAENTFSSYETSDYFHDRLKEIIGDFQCTYIIVDGLDENEESDQILLRLRRIILDTTNSIVKPILTSRDSMAHQIQNLKAYSVRVSPTHTMLREYVCSRLERVAKSDSDHFSFASEVKDALVNERSRLNATEAIASAAKGSYLLARIHVDTLQGTRGGDLEERLEKLPKTRGIEGVMQGIFDRIDEHDTPWMRDLGRNALMWAICAKRSLTMNELRHATAMSLLPLKGLGPAILEMIPSIQQLVESTCFLIEADEGNSVVEIHKSIRDYYDDNSWARENHLKASPNLKMGTACLRYLTLDHFQSGHCKSETEWCKRTTEYPFILYAAEHWGNHVRDGGEQHFNVIPEFLNSAPVIACASQALHPSLSSQDKNRHSYELCDMAFAKPLSSWDTFFTPLHLAAHFNLYETAKQTLDMGADANAPAIGNFSAIFIASLRGHSRMVRLLLDRGADVFRANGEMNLSHHNNMHCIRTASFHGHTKVVEELLKRADNTTREILLLQQDGWGVSALSNAMFGNHLQTFSYFLDLPESAKLLLHHNERKDTILHTATAWCRTDFVQLLLNAGERLGIKSQMLEAKQMFGNTALHLAVERAFERTREIVQILLDHGADPSIPGHLGMTALHTAARKGRSQHFQTLIERGYCRLLVVPNHHKELPLHRGVNLDRGTLRHALRMLFTTTTLNEADLVDVARAVASSRDETLISAALDHKPSNRMLIIWMIHFYLVHPVERFLAEEPNEISLVLRQVVHENFVDGFYAIMRSKPNLKILTEPIIDGNTLLHMATKQGNTELVQAIFDAQPAEQLEIAFNERNKTGRTPWNEALALQWPDMTKLFRDKMGSGLEVQGSDQRINHCSPSQELGLEVPPEWMSLRSMRQAGVNAFEYSGEVPYLLSQPIPTHKGPIHRIAIRFTGHDQGVASYNEHLNHTFQDCHTWVDLSRYRNDALIWGERLAFLPRAKEESTTQTIAWDAKLGVVGETGQKEIPQVQRLAGEFLHALEVGDRIAIVLKAEFRGWMCTVERAELEFFWSD